ncbi:hypothetical protein J1N35_036444 [Gossypium stocksii]|uniref:21 kDa seed protein n=1 Tax=Gossypium stocksii TaxID=47602 RepID=A0A9D3UIQ4_9ROSI|nr:hypothetical protein J1N35_036444 [Gossypium stocksii]
MKITTASVFLLFIIFSVTLSSFFFGVANATNEPVLDIDGNEVQTGTLYFVVSTIWGAGGGGLDVAMPGNTCPEVVTQRRSGDNGIPVMFSNSDSNDGIVRLSSDINIEFIVPPRPTICLTTKVWKVSNYDHSAGKWWVITDGVKGNPGPNTLTSWFRIEKVSGLAYKFKYCPTVCGTCPALCNEIGKDSDGERVRFALSTGPGWPFSFKKVERSAMDIQQVFHI